MDECVFFSSDQGGLPRWYVIRHHHPLPKILDWKGKTKYFVNGRLCCMCRDSKPGLFYLFKTILISLSSSPPSAWLQSVSVRVDG